MYLWYIYQTVDHVSKMHIKSCKEWYTHILETLQSKFPKHKLPKKFVTSHQISIVLHIVSFNMAA